MEQEHYDTGSDSVERGTEKEEALIWGSLPLMAIVGALVILVMALIPGARPWLQFVLPIGIALVLLAVMLQLNRRRRGH